MDCQKIGNFISERRKELGLTQQQLADVLDVTNKAVSKWETGEGYPDITILLDLSGALNVTADELLNGELAKRSNGHPVGEAIPLPAGKPKRERKGKTSVMSVLCILFGIILVIVAFMADVGMTYASYIDGYERFAFSFMPMYGIAVILVIGGFITNAVNKVYVSKRDS